MTQIGPKPTTTLRQKFATAVSRLARPHPTGVDSDTLETSPAPHTAPPSRPSILERARATGFGLRSLRQILSPRETAAKLARERDPNIVVSSWQDLFGGDETKQAYAQAYWSTVLEVGKLAKPQGGATCALLLEKLAAARQHIACMLGHKDPYKFGSPVSHGPDGGLHTRLNARYANVDTVQDFLAKLRTDDKAPFGDMLRGHHANPGTQWTIHAPDANGEMLPLSTLWDISPETQMWLHQVPSRKHSQQLEHLYAKAMIPHHPSEPREQRLAAVCEDVGRLHWWLAQHCPYRRGSAAIYDMLSSIIFRHHGFDHAGWRGGVSADVVALCTPSPDEFARKYRALMREDPKDS